MPRGQKRKSIRNRANATPSKHEEPIVDQYPNSNNIIRNADDMKQWAHKLDLSSNEANTRMQRYLAQAKDGEILTTYRNLNFVDFSGVTFTNKKILDLLPKSFGKRPPALDNVYRISEAPGKGYGMFASRDIPVGGIILVENPVIVLPLMMCMGSQMSKEEMMKLLFTRLAPDVRERALSLSNCKPASLCEKEEGIIRTNGLQVELPVPDVPNAPNSIHSGIFLDMCRCNHSCRSNACYRWDMNTYSMSLFALRPIRAGEEITLQFTQPADTREVRRGRLLSMYCFLCQCEYCALPEEAVPASDSARLEIKEMWQNGNPNITKWRGGKLTDQALVRLNKRAIELHEQEGILGLQEANHLDALALAYLKLGDAKNFKICGERAKERWREMQCNDKAVVWERLLATLLA